MTIARAQMYRQLYQMGGIGTLPMDYGQSLQVNNQSQMPAPNYSSAVNITANPLLNYGQTELNQSGGTPLTMRSGGMTRLGYQEGGMGIMGAMPQDSSMMQQEGGTEQTALLTIIQLLIEQGVPPEKAEELAMQILQIFNQGGAPAVEEFANQLEQEEGMSENRTMMAGGGITNLYPRQGFFVKGIVKSVGKAVKGVANAVKSVAKSPIGQIALAIAAPYAIGAMFPAFATLGGTGFMGAALRAGISNLAIQGITTGKINPKQALMAAIGGGVAQGVFGPAGGATTDVTQGTINAGGAGIPGADIADIAGTSTLSSGVTQSLPTSSFSDLTGQVQPGSMVYNPPTTAAARFPELEGLVRPSDTVVNMAAPQPGIIDRGISSIQDFGSKLVSDPMGTIKTGITSLYDTATQTIKDNPYTAVGTSFLAGTQFRAPLPGEDPNEYNRLKAEHDAKVAGYITQYGGGANVYSPGQYGLYARENAIDPFAGRLSYAADGGQITNRQNYLFGSKVSAVATPQSGGGTGGSGFFGGLVSKMIQQNPQMFKPQGMTSYEGRYRDLINFIDENKNGIDDRQEASYGGRMGYAEGSIGFERKTLERKGYGDMMKNMTPKEISQLYDSVMGTFSRRFQAEGSMPMGEPRKNPAGIMELDYRAKGGFVPPIGIKEKADDIPAMLSNNEFVFTANAVRNAGGGDVDRGAQRMYSLMKTLENGGRV